MHHIENICVYILLTFMSCTCSMAATAEFSLINKKKGTTSSKSRTVQIPIMLETLRSDMKRMQATLERMSDGFEKLEERCMNQFDVRAIEKNFVNGNHQFVLSTSDEATLLSILANITNNPSLEILNEKLERISRTQERNSRLINIEMTSLTNLEESFNRLENTYRRIMSLNNNTSINSSTLTYYQQQVVNKLISIDEKLDNLPPGLPSVTVKINGSDEAAVDAVIDENNYESSKNATVTSCESLRNTGRKSGVFLVERSGKVMSMIWENVSKIYCDLSTDGGGWTVIQRRGGFYGEHANFTQSWDNYANGFGDLNREFWLGNQVVHRLTSYYGQYELRIELEDWDGQSAWALYSDFELSSRVDGYRIKVADYTGNATDSLSAHDSTPFSTFDHRNDLAPRCCPCTTDYGGGWWYYSCFEANLNGDYYVKGQRRQPFRGIIWEHWRGDYSLKSTAMMIRKKYR